MATSTITFSPDDRFGIVGGIGSGKTYGAGVMVEKLLADKHRVIIVDPLGVWHGLRVLADGRAGFPVVIFGGDHGDFPLTEKSAALVGETIATMAESVIIDLSHIGTKAGERRIMLAILTALYAKTNGEPVHVVMDEADMWAPQNPSDKEGGTIQLLGMMETIVRRGRIRGFNVWMITQRPAVLNKNVLSQITGLIAFRMTAPQDRKALSDWTSSHGDAATAAKLLDTMPGLPKGSALVWIPNRDYFERVDFPKKVTKDTSAAPKRGESRRAAKIPPLNVDKLRERLATVEEEAKANDPVVLRAEIARLKREALSTSGPAKAVEKIDTAAIEAARAEARSEGVRTGKSAVIAALKPLLAAMDKGLDVLSDAVRAINGVDADAIAPAAHYTKTPKSGPKAAAHHGQSLPDAGARVSPPAKPAVGEGAAGSTISGPQALALKALAFWAALGDTTPTRAKLCAVCGWKVSSGHIKNVLGSLKTAGLVIYPSPGTVSLTNEGTASAPAPDTATTVRAALAPVLSGPQALVVDLLLKSTVEELDRDTICEELGWERSSGHIKNVCGSLKTLEIITYPRSGWVKLESWVRQ